ncbi:hypothetical protein L6475_13540 [Prevotella sp. E9-3]|uniref:hypothetical protein n=1 Tax=Prevotella sp. E9-3 TaxID=2913621 RepID=UPI001EDB6633|nr:hypothetical protein [Prevotella sp. E9-3]UKK48211.1 hypothetical protein L6475_13540 [Prevotella sp. E9-3]
MALLLYYNCRSIATQPPFSCNTTTIQLQCKHHSIAVENKCYFTIVVKTIPSHQEKMRQNMRFAMKKQKKSGKIGCFSLQAMG